MGTWGPGVFENDTACDFASEVAYGGGIAVVEEALDHVLSHGDEHLDEPETQEGLAAADIVARLRGNFGQRDAHTDSIDAWVESEKPDVPEELVGKAQQAVAGVIEEAYPENWKEPAMFEEWKREAEGVLKRLQAA